MARNEQIERIIRDCLDGILSRPAATARLDVLKVRGGFTQARVPNQYDPGASFCGYDYEAQKWIEV